MLSIDLKTITGYNSLMTMEFKSLENIVLSRDQVRSCDAVAIERYSIDGRVLMENAGAAAAKVVKDLLQTVKGKKVCILAGTGNNGGDAYVVARHLANHNIPLQVIICGDRRRISGDALCNLKIIEKMDLPILCPDPENTNTVIESVRSLASSADVIVDGLLGTGTAGPPRDPIRSVITLLNELRKPVLALDIPSGLDCDTGLPLELAVYAAKTVTFAAMKKGFQNPASKAYTGHVSVASIGIHTSWLIENEK